MKNVQNLFIKLPLFDDLIIEICAKRWKNESVGSTQKLTRHRLYILWHIKEDHRKVESTALETLGAEVTSKYLQALSCLFWEKQ